MNRLRQDAKQFFADHKWEVCLAAFLLALAMYRFLFSANYRMDSIIKLTTLGDEFNDLELGRFGIVYLNRLFGMRQFTPYFAAWLTLIGLMLSSALLSFSLWKAAGDIGRAACFLPLLVYLTPNWIEQLFFSYQSPLIMLGVILLQIAVLLPAYFPARRFIAAEVLLVFIALSVYQAFAPLYIALCLGFVLIGCAGGRISEPAEVWRRGLRYALVFFAAIACYLAVNGLLQLRQNANDYLTSQVRWGTAPVQGVMINIFRCVFSLLTAQSRLDTPTLSVSALCALALIGLSWRQTRDHRRALTCALGWLLLQLSALAMIVVLGDRSYIRAELEVTFIAAYNFAIALLLARKLTRGRTGRPIRRLPAAAVLLALALCLNAAAQISFRLMYTDDIRSDGDNALAERLVERLKATGVDSDGRSVVFIGERDATLDAGCISGEVIGRSLFKYVNDIESTNYVIEDLLAVHGLTYREITPSDVRVAEDLARTMPDYPAEGSIVETDDAVVVKFSDDYYFEAAVMEPGYTLSEETVEYGDGYLCGLDSVQSDGTKLALRGIGILRGVDARQVENDLYFLDRVTGALYRINTACERRVMLTNQYWQDGVSYDQGGYVALCPMELFQSHPENLFEVLVRYTVNGETRFASTGAFLNLRSLDRARIINIPDGFMRNEQE